MDTTGLSSNWKKLQAKLAGDQKTEHGIAPTNGLSGVKKSLKRKATDDIAGRRSKPITRTLTLSNKRQKPSEAGASKKSSAPATMGAYVSSLPGVSYGTHKHQNIAGIAPTAPGLPTPKQPGPPKIGAQMNGHTPSTVDSNAQAGKYVGLDCEMVGTHSLTPFSILAHSNRYQPASSTAPPEYSILARVTLVSYSFETIYDAYVLPPTGVRISDYRTRYSGITPWHLNPANTTTAPKTFDVVQREVAALLAGRVLVGHALKNDLEILGLSHPRRDIRDTARYPPFRALAAVVGRDGKPGKAKTPSLKKLATEVLGRTIQADENKGHDSAEDAGAAMALFKMEKAGFEREVVKAFGRAAVMRKGGALRDNKAVAGATKIHPAQSRASSLEDDEERSDNEDIIEDDSEFEAGDDDTPGDNATAKPPGMAKRKNKRKKRTKRA